MSTGELPGGYPYIAGTQQYTSYWHVGPLFRCLATFTGINWGLGKACIRLWGS